MLYNYVAKFETELFISPVSCEINDMLSALGMSVPVAKSSIQTKATIKAMPLLDDEKILELCKIQNEEYTKGLENNNKIDKKIRVGKTRFLGYETVSEHKEGVS